MPVMGVIFLPVTGVLYFGSGETGARKVEVLKDWKDGRVEDWVVAGQRLPVEDGRSVYTIVGSKSHMTAETAEYMEKLKREHGEVEVLSRGSSLKITMVAEGAADVYPRFAPTMEWDVAAGAALIAAGGGRVTLRDGTVPTFNQERPLFPNFVAAGAGRVEELVSDWLVDG